MGARGSLASKLREPANRPSGERGVPLTPLSSYTRHMDTALVDAARKLDVEARVDLVSAIWNTIAESASLEALPVAPSHVRELDRRLDGESDLEAAPWEDVRERLRRGL